MPTTRSLASAQSPLNRAGLVSVVADQAGLTSAKAAQAVDAVFGAIESALRDGREVRLTGFGSFSVSTRKATTGRNPRTGAAIEIGPSHSVRFKPGRSLKESRLAKRAVSSAVERLVYTERAGGSNPSPPTIQHAASRSVVRGLTRRVARRRWARPACGCSSVG